MPEYTFKVSLKYSKEITIEAETEDDAYHLACETRDHEIVDDATGADFSCELINSEVKNA